MKIRKDIINLTIPVVVEQIFIVSLGVVNTIMASRVGNSAVTSIGIVDSFSTIFLALFASMAVGGTVVVAQYSGKNRTNEANEASSQAVFSGVIIAFVISFFSYVFQYQIIKLLCSNADQTVINNSLIYFRVSLFSYPLMAIVSIGLGVLRGAKDTKTPMKISMIMNLFNIVLSYLFIYGLNIKSLGIYIPGLEVKGAAIAICLSRMIGAIYVLYVLFSGQKSIKINFKNIFKLNFIILAAIFSIGIPSSIESLLFQIGKFITQEIVLNMGTIASASSYISFSLIGLINIPATALGISATTMVGHYMGKGKHDEAQKAMIYILKLSVLFLFFVSLATIPFVKFLASIYSNDLKVIELTSTILITAALVQPIIWPFAFVLPAALRGAGDAKFTMVSSVIGMWVFRIVLGYILGVYFSFGVIGVWTGMYTDWIARGLLNIFRLKSGRWKQKVVIN